MPRRSQASVNSTFVKMRQNQEGTIVMLPTFHSRSFSAYKQYLTDGAEVQPALSPEMIAQLKDLVKTGAKAVEFPVPGAKKEVKC